MDSFENNYQKKMIVLRAERLPTTWTIMFPTFRVCKSVFEKRNPQVRIVIGFPLLSPFGARVHPQIAWAKLRALRDGTALASRTFLELNSKLPVRMRENEKEETRSTSEPSFLPSRQCQKQRLAPCFKL